MFRINSITGLFTIAVALTGCSWQGGASVQPVNEGHKVETDSGMVVSAHAESSRIGVSILRMGGNAVDAAVATEFALAVCYPEAGNIGGGGFMIIRTSDGDFDMVDYREKAPGLASRDMYLDETGEVKPGLSTESHLASGVPGTVDGMINVHSKYGLLSFSEVIQPSIDLARHGFPVTRGQADDLNRYRERFIERNNLPVDFVREKPWKEGDTLRQANLAITLERIRDLGRDGFYSGTTARLIAQEMRQGNGIITGKDLAEYNSAFRDPVSSFYHGYRVVSVSPPSGGGLILTQVLGMLEPFNISSMGFHSPESVHLITEACRRAFADRSFFYGDPSFTVIPVEALISQEYLAGRMKSFDKDHATPSGEIREGSPGLPESEETTHYSVVDVMGNAVAATTTLNGTFGSGIVVDSAGFLLNNQMDDFSLKPGIPNMFGLTGGEANSVQPGKRMLSSMTPVIVEKDGSLFLVAGSPGGSTIPTTVMQVLINVIDFGMDVGQAVDTGRFHHQWLPDFLSIESQSIDTLVIETLRKMGHDVRSRGSIGRVNAIMIGPDGARNGAADKRGNNSACGY